MPKYNKHTYQMLINVLLASIVVITLFSLYKCQTNYKQCRDTPSDTGKNKDRKSHKGHKGYKGRDNAPNDEDIGNEDIGNEDIGNEYSGNEDFLDASMYNPPIINGKIPKWWGNLKQLYGNTSSHNNQAQMYPSHNTRSQAFYNQGVYPNMSMPPQVIGCGGRRMPCLGGTQETIPVIPPPIEISERNIAPVNIFTRPFNPTDAGVIHQVGVLYKIFGNENEIYPLYGVRRYRNSDSWDYSTKIGREGNFVYVRIRTKQRNNNELQTNDEVTIDGHTHKYRVTIYDHDFSEYVPHIRL